MRVTSVCSCQHLPTQEKLPHCLCHHNKTNNKAFVWVTKNRNNHPQWPRLQPICCRSSSGNAGHNQHRQEKSQEGIQWTKLTHNIQECTNTHKLPFFWLMFMGC